MTSVSPQLAVGHMWSKYNYKVRMSITFASKIWTKTKGAVPWNLHATVLQLVKLIKVCVDFGAQGFDTRQSFPGQKSPLYWFNL